MYESVCAFLNRNGGEILLGVNDRGDVIGVNDSVIDQLKKDFTTAMNNPQKINPTFYLSIEEFNIFNKNVLYIFVPVSSQVHRCNGKIFDRTEDGDIDITNHTNDVATLYERKQQTYSESRIFRYVTIKNLREDLIARVRKATYWSK